MATAQRRPHQRELLAPPLMAAVGLNSVGVICRWKWLSSVHQHTPYLASWLRLVSPVWRFNSHTGSYFLSTSCLIIKTILGLLYLPLKQLRLTSLRCLCHIFCLFSTKAFPQQSCTQASGPIGGISSPPSFLFFSSFQPHPHLSSSVSADQSCYLCFVFNSQACWKQKRERCGAWKPSKLPYPTSAAWFTAQPSPLGQRLRWTWLKRPLYWIRHLVLPPREQAGHPESCLLTTGRPFLSRPYSHPARCSRYRTCSPTTKMVLIVEKYQTDVVYVCVCAWVGAHEPLEQNSCKRISFVAGGRAWRRPARCRRPCGLCTWQPPPL